MGGVNMKRSVKFLFLCLLGISLISCTKEWNEISGAGSPVRFGASTQYRNALETRTEYSGVVTNGIERIDWLTSDKIRVYSPDVTRAFVYGGDEHWADYQINGFGRDHSIATLKNVQPNGLAWPDNNSHTFYSIYPSPETDEGKATNLPGMQGVFSGTIPATQVMTWSGEGSNARVGKPDMNLAYMFARRTSRPSAGNTELDFKPMINTFMFTLAAEQEMTVNSFEMISSSCALTGDFSVKVTQDTEVDVLARTVVPDSDITRPAFEDGTNNKVTVDLGGATLSPEKTVTFTIFAIPQEITDLTIQLNTSGGVKKLKLNDKNGNPVKFPTFLKANINGKTTPNEWEYILEFVDGTVMVTLGDGTEAALIERSLPTEGITSGALFDSYRNKTDGTVSNDRVAYQVEYALADEQGEPGTWSSSLPEGLLGLQADFLLSEDEMAYAEPPAVFRSSLLGQVNENTEIERVDSKLIDHARILKANAPVSDVDLSLYEVYDLTAPRASGKPVTANSYVVDRPGTYRFPLVYGNAVDWNMEMKTGCNVRAYNTGRDGIRIVDDCAVLLDRFPNAKGNPITSPYILKDLGLSVSDVEAVILWQDVEGPEYSMLSVTGIEEVNNGLFKDVDGSALASVPYITFEVPVGNIIEDESIEPGRRVTGIRQGNAVIGLRERGSSEFLWSWHIWLTDFPMEGYYLSTGDWSLAYNGTLNYFRSTASNQILPNDLGWCDTRKTTYYKQREWFVKISQTEGSADPIYCKIVQGGRRVATGNSSGTLYQLGRKDPFIPVDDANASGGGMKPAYSALGLLNGGHHNARLNNATRANLSIAIANPAVLFHNSEVYDYWADPAEGYYDPLDAEYDRSGLFINLWNGSPELKSYVETDYDEGHEYDYQPVKTVFDPCPPGYCVPSPSFLNNMTRQFRQEWGISPRVTQQIWKWRALDVDLSGTYTISGDIIPESGVYFLAGEEDEIPVYFPLLYNDGISGRTGETFPGNGSRLYAHWRTNITDRNNSTLLAISVVDDMYIDGTYVWTRPSDGWTNVDFATYLEELEMRAAGFSEEDIWKYSNNRASVDWYGKIQLDGCNPVSIRPVREKDPRGVRTGEMEGHVSLFGEYEGYGRNQDYSDWTVENQ